MLKVMRRLVKSTAIKVLMFGILIVSFSLWSIAELFINNSQQTFVATIADQKLDAMTYVRQLKQVIDQTNLSLSDINTKPELSKLIEQSILNQWSLSVILAQEVKRLHLVVSDEQIQQFIIKESTFQDEKGNFSRHLFEDFLSNNYKNEKQFLRDMRSELSQSILINAIIQGLQVPTSILTYIRRYHNQYRSAHIIKIAAASLTQDHDISEAEIQEFYTNNKELFRIPEIRRVNILNLELERIAQTISLPEKEIVAFFEQNLDKYIVPEQRTVERILFDNESQAQAAWTALQKGDDFYKVAMQISNLNQEDLKLGPFTQQNFVDRTLADAAFNIEQGNISKPLQGLLGWMIIRVSSIEREHVPSLSNIRSTIVSELQHEQAENLLHSYVRQLETKLARGISLDDIAMELPIKQEKLTLHMTAFQSKDDIQLLDQVAGLNNLKQGVLFKDNKGGYRAIELIEVIDSYIPEIDNIRADVISEWQNKQQHRKALDQAQTIAQKINHGADLIELSDFAGLKLYRTQPINRTGTVQQINTSFTQKNKDVNKIVKLDSQHIDALFSLKPNTAVALSSNTGAVVMQLEREYEQDNNLEHLIDILHKQLLREAYIALEIDLRKRYPMEINKEVLAQIYNDADINW